MESNLIDDESKEHPPVEAKEISESENEDSNMMKSNSSARNKDKDLNRSNNMNKVIEENSQMKRIIQDQYQRLNEMKSYIDLCEKKIALLDSNQLFPIQASDCTSKPYTVNKECIQFLSERGFDSIDQFIDDYLNKESNLNILKQSNDQLKQNCHILNTRSSQAMIELSKLTTELGYLKKIEEEHIKFKETYHNTFELNTHLNEEKVLMINNINKLKDHLNQRESTIESMSLLLKQNNCQYQEQLNQLRATVYNEMKREFNIFNRELYYNIQEKDKEINALKAKILSMEHDMLMTQSYANKAELMLSSNDSQLKTQCELSDNLAKNTSLSMTKLMNDNRELNENIQSNEVNHRKLGEDKEMITMKYNNMKESYNSLNEKYTTVNEDFSRIQVEYKKIEELYSRISIKYKMLCTEYALYKEDTSREIATIKKNNHDLLNQNELVLNDNNQLKLKFNMVNESLKSKEIEVIDVKGKLEQIKCNYDTIRQYNINLELKAKESAENNRRLEQSILTIKEELSNKHLNQSSILYSNEKLANERYFIIEELSKEKTTNKDKEILLANIIKLLRDDKSKLLNLKEDFLSYDFIAYLTEPSIAKDYNENINLIEDFISNTVNEYESLKRKFNEQSQMLNQAHEDKLKYQSDKDTLLNNAYALECKIKAQQDDIGIQVKKIQGMTNEYKSLQRECEDVKQLNDKLTHENKQRKDIVICSEKKNEQINEAISLYEAIHCLIEEILIKVTKCCLHNTNIGILVDDLVKGNYDLIQAHRDKLSRNTINDINQSTNDSTLLALNDSIDCKFKDIQFIYSNILKEITIEQRLKGIINQ